MDLIRSEIQDKEAVFDMNAPIEGVTIDSIDVIHVVFKVEEEYGIQVDLDQNAKYETVGEFVEALLKFVPLESKAS